MVYHYVCYWAEVHPELAVLAINTLQKESKDSDPMVRGLALRSLCSLSVPEVKAYVSGPVQAGLRDPLPYVRKTAVMCVLRLFHLDPDSFDRDLYVHALYGLVKDEVGGGGSSSSSSSSSSFGSGSSSGSCLSSSLTHFPLLPLGIPSYPGRHRRLQLHQRVE